MYVYVIKYEGKKPKILDYVCVVDNGKISKTCDMSKAIGIRRHTSIPLCDDEILIELLNTPLCKCTEDHAYLSELD